jgi:DeoR/GlpR family transcriptional regulator of sugar metabolism
VSVRHQAGDHAGDAALPSRRRALLTAFVDEQGQATVTELADAFKVSADTVRRDLDWLAQRGAVSRTYGGAVTMSGLATTDTSFSDRSSVHREEKQRIAAAAAERIADGETVILNGGTTTLAVAHALGIRRHLTIVTNNLRVPPALPASAVRDVYLLGGSCRLTSHVTIGPVAFPGTEGISADVAVIGVGGVSARAGFTTTNLQEAQMMAQMIESAQRTIVVMHSSKFGRSAFAHIVRLDAIGLLITDQLPEAELREALAAAEVEIVVASGLSRSSSWPRPDDPHLEGGEAGTQAPPAAATEGKPAESRRRLADEPVRPERIVCPPILTAWRT